MSTIVLDRDAAKLLVDVALSAVSRDDITPVICGAHVTVDDGKLRVTATDRYRVHTALVEAKSIDGEVDAIIPRAALEWLAKNRTYFGGTMREYHRIRIDIGAHLMGGIKPIPGALSIVVCEAETDDANCVAWNGRHTVGNFPPVMKLVEAARAAEVAPITPRLNIGFISRINRIAQHPHTLVRVKHTVSANPNKPGPVLFALEEIDGQVIAEALLQPNLEPSR